MLLLGAFSAAGQVNLMGAKIDGTLDCSGGELRCDTDSALVLASATILGDVMLSDGFRTEGPVVMEEANIGGDLYCTGGKFLSSQQVALRCLAVRIGGSVYFDDGFKATGEVTLERAVIDGILSCNAGLFLNPGGIALSGNAAKFKAAVYLNNDFYANGNVTFRAATINGNLDCSNGKFLSSGRSALDCQTSIIGGQVYLSVGFLSHGMVDFEYTTVGGFLTCSGGIFVNPGSTALSANSANFKSDVFMAEGFYTNGAVEIIGATIQGSLNCDDGEFHGSDNLALSVNSTNIGGQLILRHGFLADGQVDLRAARIGGNLDCSHGEFRSSQDFALNANSASIRGHAFLRDGFIAKGGVELGHAEIGGDLECNTAHLSSISNTCAIAGRLLKVGHNIRFDSDEPAFVAEGEIFLQGATIGGDLICDGGNFLAHGENVHYPDALDVSAAEINGSVFLRKHFHATGKLNFKNCHIKQNFVIQGIDQPERFDLDLRFAKVGTLLNAKDSWPNKGALHLHGFLYDEIDTEARPEDANLQVQWITRGESDSEESARNDIRSISDLKPVGIVNASAKTNSVSDPPVSSKFLPQPYEQLAKTLRNMGLGEAAVQVMITKNSEEGGDIIAHDYSSFRQTWKSITTDWRKGKYIKAITDGGKIVWDLSWYKGLGKLIDYGYHPLHAFILSLLFITVGSAIFKLGYVRNVIVPDSETAYEPVTGWTHKLEDGHPRRLKESYPRFDAFIYSLETFVPLVDLGLGDKWIPNVNRTADFRLGRYKFAIPGSAFRWYRWIHILSGWVLTTLWVGGFTGLIKS